MTGIQIALTKGGAGTILLDGADVSQHVRGFTLNGNVGDMPTMIIRMSDDCLARIEARVLLPESAQAILRAAGWTPPAEGAE